MKLSERTVNLLKNFASINENILIPPTEEGESSLLRTRNVGNNIYAEAFVDETFDTEIRIYNLTQFLNVMDMFDDPDFNFKETHVTVSDGSSRIRYNYASKNILHYADKSPKIPSFDVSGVLKHEELKRVREAAKRLELPTISIAGDGTDVYLIACDVADTSANEFRQKVEMKAKGTDEFRVHFSVNNLIMIPEDYNFSLNMKGISVFENTDLGVKYAIAMRVG